MNTTANHFATEAEAIAYLTARFTDDGPADIARYVKALRDEHEDDGQSGSAWWDGISGDDLGEQLFRIIK